MYYSSKYDCAPVTEKGTTSYHADIEYYCVLNINGEEPLWGTSYTGGEISVSRCNELVGTVESELLQGFNGVCCYSD